MRVATFARRLVAADVDAICKAGDRDVTRPARELRWRGARGSDTHAGTTGLAIPNLHHDSYHPGRLLEPREHAAGGGAEVVAVCDPRAAPHAGWRASSRSRSRSSCRHRAPVQIRFQTLPGSQIPEVHTVARRTTQRRVPRVTLR